MDLYDRKRDWLIAKIKRLQREVNQLREAESRLAKMVEAVKKHKSMRYKSNVGWIIGDAELYKVLDEVEEGDAK